MKTSTCSFAHRGTWAALTVTFLLATPRDALAQEDAPPANSSREDEDGPAMAANRGFNLGLGPAILSPIRPGGPWGGGATIDGRYGIKTGPLVLAPGAMFAGYAISGHFIAIPMGTFRVTAPIGPLAPFVVGGVGYGWITNPAESGVALLAGGGLMIHFGRVFAIGAEATYQTITTTNFQTVAIGPSIIFGG